MTKTQSLRKPLWILIGFVVTVLLVNEWMLTLGWTLLEPAVNERGSQALHAYVSRPATEDVLLIGSSRVEGGLDARIIQERLRGDDDPDLLVYKLGLAGLRPLRLSRILEDGVARRPPRKLLVIAIEARQFVRPAPRSRKPGATAVQAPTAPRGEWEIDRVVARFWDMFRGVKGLWSVDWIWRAEVQAISRTWSARGGEFLTVEERRQEEIRIKRIQQRRPDRPDRFDLVKFGWDWTPPDGPDAVGFRRSLEILETLPCDVLFVRLPLEADFDENDMPIVSERFFSEVVGDVEARGFHFVDLNGAPWPEGAPYFLTRTHLNMLGCDRTSEMLTDRLLLPWLRDGSWPSP